MARMLAAAWKPLGAQTEPRLMRKNKIIIHTMVGTLRGTDSMFRAGGYDGTESHFGTSATGEAWQWQDTDFQADAQLEGNDDAISIENEDWGINNWRGNGPVPPFTKAQVSKLITLCTELCLEHDIPAKQLKDSEDSSRGIGTHRLGIDPYRQHGEHYSLSMAKACPGDARIAQVNNIIIPAVAKAVKEANDITTGTPNITEALRANAEYRKALRAIDNPRAMAIVERSKRNAWEDFKSLQKLEVK